MLQVLKLECKTAISILEEIPLEEPQVGNHLDSAVIAIKLYKYSRLKNLLFKKHILEANSSANCLPHESIIYSIDVER